MSFLDALAGGGGGGSSGGGSSSSTKATSKVNIQLTQGSAVHPGVIIAGVAVVGVVALIFLLKK